MYKEIGDSENTLISNILLNPLFGQGSLDSKISKLSLNLAP